ncbi:MAG: YihY family inner membrane protein [Rhodospirillaceae bacterium]|nr:YihY family inner membrane protein [Rhodospirillaceae bacterium]
MTEAKSRIDDREKPAAWRAVRAAGDFCVYLGLRFWKDHNFSAAASLSYTTLLAVVPLAAIGFSILAAFPVFDRIRTDLLSFILEIFLPQNVEAVRGQFDLFLRNTRELTAVGTVALAVTAVILLDTVDTWFNRIWRQPEVRPLVQRMTMYWAVLTVTPLLAGGSIAISTYLFAQANLGVVEGSWVQNTAVRWLPPLLLFVSFAVAYMVIPYRKVRLGYAALGAVVALLLYDGLKWGFSLYFHAFPSYETLYGALSYIPLLLIWMYLVWCAVLFGAQTAAALPEWLALQRHGAPGESRATRRLGQAMVILHGLYRAGETGRPVDTETLLEPLPDSAELLEPLLERLEALHYIARSNEDAWILSRDPAALTVYEIARDLGITIRPGLGGLQDEAVWTDRLDSLIGLSETAQKSVLDVSLRELFGAARENDGENAVPTDRTN